MKITKLCRDVVAGIKSLRQKDREERAAERKRNQAEYDAYLAQCRTTGDSVLKALKARLPELNPGISDVYTKYDDVILPLAVDHLQDIRTNNGQGKLLARLNYDAREAVSHKDLIDTPLEKALPTSWSVSLSVRRAILPNLAEILGPTLSRYL